MSKIGSKSLVSCVKTNSPRKNSPVKNSLSSDLNKILGYSSNASHKKSKSSKETFPKGKNIEKSIEKNKEIIS